MGTSHLCISWRRIGTVGTSVLRERDEVFRAVEITIVVGRDVGDEVGGLVWPQDPVTDANCIHEASSAACKTDML